MQAGWARFGGLGLGFFGGEGGKKKRRANQGRKPRRSNPEYAGLLGCAWGVAAAAGFAAGECRRGSRGVSRGAAGEDGAGAGAMAPERAERI